MVKIGRNEQCPCGSGRKYKKCCLQAHQANPDAELQPQKISVKEEVVRLQQSAKQFDESMKIIGVFIFFSTKDGDAWVLEMTDMDAVVVARGGKAIEVEINESPETIEVNWSHQFSVKGKTFTTTAYADKAVETYSNYPTAAISATIKKLQSRFSSELLQQIHVDPAK